VFELLECPN